MRHALKHGLRRLPRAHRITTCECFLTLAEIGVSRLRYPFAAAGALALVAGCVLWPLVEAGTL